MNESLRGSVRFLVQEQGYGRAFNENKELVLVLDGTSVHILFCLCYYTNCVPMARAISL
jgi:hypothetical protein